MASYKHLIGQVARHILRVQNSDDRPIWPYTRVAQRLPLSIAIALADYHDSAGHDLAGMKTAYEDFIDRLMQQYAALVSFGFTFEPLPTDSQATSTSKAIFKRLDNTGRLAFYRTDLGFGDGLATIGHPLLRSAGITLQGYNLAYNDILRIVHDMLGHYHIRSNFTPLGEYKAFLSHLQLFGVHSLASSALLLETIIQSSWFECGRHIRRPDNSIARPDDSDYIRLKDRPFAVSKIYRPIYHACQLIPANIRGNNEQQR